MSLPFRSVLFVPASNAKALAKAVDVRADAIILDLEDAVSPTKKDIARASALRTLRAPAFKTPFRTVRINSLTSGWGESDVLALTPEPVHALVVPKVESAAMLRQVRTVMARARVVPGKAAPALWAMVETPRGLLNLKDIAECATETGLTTLIVGTNDLAKDLGCDGVGENREALRAHLSAIVLMARCTGLVALDGVYNAYADADGFQREADQGRRFGFDGKTLIHPAQIEIANRVFGPGEEAIKQARAIVRAFALKKNAGKGVIALNGVMVERLHLHEAQALLDLVPDLSAKPSAQKGKRTS